MAATAGHGTSIPRRSLISLEPEERRKVLLESLRAEYTPIREVFHTISANESLYISQFSSGRWRESIYKSSILQQSSEDSDTDDSSEDASEEDSQKPMVMFGYDLQSKEHRREAEMIMRWNVVEREKHFPNLEKNYVEKRRAKDQVKCQDVGVPQSPPSAMELIPPSARGVSETSSTSTKEVGESSKVTLQDVSMEESTESLKPEPEACQESPKTVPEACQESSKTVPEACQESPKTMPEACKESSGKSFGAASSVTPDIQKTSANLQEGTDDTKEKASLPDDSKLSPSSSESDDSKLAKSSASKMETSGSDSKLAKGSSESDDSKLAKRASESEMETSGATSRGKRKADSAATSDGEDPDEKRTRKTSGDK